MLENIKPFLPIILILVIIILAIGIITKLIKTAILLALALVIIPTLFTVFFADGSDIIAKTAKYLPDDRAQLLEDGYQYFKDKESQNPALDVEQIQKDAGETVEQVQDKITDIGNDLIESMEKFDPNSFSAGDFKLNESEKENQPEPESSS